jgi:hypothetical protein
VPTSPSPPTSRQARWTSGSRTWPPGTGPSPASSPTGRARRSRPRTPTTATSARRSPPGPAHAGSRFCSRPCPRSRPPADPRTRGRPRRRLGSRGLTWPGASTKLVMTVPAPGPARGTRAAGRRPVR